MDIVVMPGDGIGPEITAATLEVLRAVNQAFGLDVRYEVHEIGLSTLKTVGTTLPPAVVERARAVDGAILGPMSSFDYPSRAEGGINQSAEFRIGFDLYANIRQRNNAPSNAAAAINRAVDQVLADPATRTPDIGGTLGTAWFGEVVSQAVISQAARAA